MKYIQSAFMKLKQNDFVKGMVVAALSAGLGAIAPAVAAGTLLSVTVLQGAGQAAIYGGAAYLVKNFFTNSEGKMKPEPGA